MKDKHAYWVPVDCNFAGDSGVRCSNCDFFVSDHVDSIEEYYYCPKCGFIMGEPIKEHVDNELFKIPQKPENKKRHYIFIPCKTDEYGMKLETTFVAKDVVRCSKCGNTLDMDGVNSGRGDANFCPKCGRKMKR